MRSVILCPFSAGTVLWQAQSGAWTLSVCVRGTFSLVHGRESVLADAQEPVAGDRYPADDPRQSLYSPSDLVPYKPRADVLLVGSAFAPDQEPVDALVARLSLGAVDKAIGVIGDRIWIEGPDGLEPSAPRPFVTMPLGYERVARGRHNPHGFDLIRAPVPGAPALPNLEAVDDELREGRAVGFGPVAPGAAARRGLLRADGWAWVEGGGRGPAPAGFDFAFYNAAPPDQQLDVLRGGDALVLENLDRRHPRLETRLPSVRPKAFLVPADVERGIEIALRCDTVWIDTDRRLLTLSWRGLVTVDTPDEEAVGALVIAAESKGREIGYAQIAKLLREGTMSTTDSDTLTESRPLRPRAESVGEIDPDLLPTPGPFRAKRPLPAMGTAVTTGSPVGAPERVPQTPPASVEAASPHPPSPPGSAAKVPAVAKAPVVIEAEDTGGPASWEELTGSDLFEISTVEEPKTLTRIDVRGRLDDAAPAGRRPGAPSDAAHPGGRPGAPSDAAHPGGRSGAPSDAAHPGRHPGAPSDAAHPGEHPGAPSDDETATKPLLQAPPSLPRELQVADYARIAVAVERGEAARALFEYGLTLPDLPRVQRNWTERSAADPAFARALAQAVAAARRS